MMIKESKAATKFQVLTVRDWMDSSIIVDAYNAEKVEIVTLVANDKESDCIPDLKEVGLIRKLIHPNILKFYGTPRVNDEIKDAYEYEECPFYLSDVLDQQIEILFKPEIVKQIMIDLFSALDYLHKNGVVHRNIQPENLALTSSGALKVWNFRYAQTVGQPLEKIKSLFVSYQPLESILQGGKADPSLDIWSAILIFGELWLKKPVIRRPCGEFIFESIFILMGFPTTEYWEDFFNFPEANSLEQQFKKYKSPLWISKFYKLVGENDSISVKGLKLLENCMRLNPKKRLTAEECLAHEYFSERPGAGGYEVMKTLCKLTMARMKINTTKREIRILKHDIYTKSKKLKASLAR